MQKSKNGENNIKAVLVTGGCGFIGVNLVKYLSARAYRVRVLDNLSAGSEDNLKKALNQYPGIAAADLVVGDIRNREDVNLALKGTDAVVHLAAHTSVIESLEKPVEDWEINAAGTLNVLEASRQSGVTKFVLASSNAVLGEQPPPISEQNIPAPLSPYGASKLAGEGLCAAYYHSFGLKTVSLRFANCYGPYSDHTTGVVVKFMKQAKEEKPLIIFGDGEQTRDLVHVDDVCQAIYLSLITESLPFGEVFQIASGTETSINNLAKTIGEVAKKKLQVTYEPERTGEIKRNYSDITKAKRLMGFQPEVSLRKGLTQLWENQILQSQG